MMQKNINKTNNKLKKIKPINESSDIDIILGFYPLFLQIMYLVLLTLNSKKALKNINKTYDTNISEKISKIVSEKVIVYKIKSNDINAFTLGNKDDLTLYYFTGLKSKLNFTDDEIIAILLHEYGHCKEGHIPKSQRKYVAFELFVGVVWSIILTTILTHVKNMTTWVSINYFSLLSHLFYLILGQNRIHARSVKWMEIEADKYPIKYGYKKEFLSALRKIKKYIYQQLCKGLSESECDEKMKEWTKWTSSQPIKDRIDTASKNLISFFKIVFSLLKSGNIDKLKKIIYLQKIKKS